MDAAALAARIAVLERQVAGAAGDIPAQQRADWCELTMAAAALAARIAVLERQVAAMSRRQGAPFALARSTLAPNDTGPVQTVQGQMDALSTRDAMPVLFHYGFTANLPVGTDKLVTFLDAERSKAVVVATGHQEYRLKGLANGEVALYDMRGRFVKLGASSISVQANNAPVEVDGATTITFNATGTVTVNAPLLQCSGDIRDNYHTNTRTMAGERAIYDIHTHNQPADSHGDTEQPTLPPNQLE